MSDKVTDEEKEAKLKAFFERARKGVLTFLEEQGGSLPMGELHEHSLSKYFIQHQGIHPMKLVSIEPTPNPNSMKVTLDVSLDPGVKYTFTQQNRDRCPAQVQALLAIPGVETVFQVADFLSVQRHPSADWETILTHVRSILAGEEAGAAASDAQGAAVPAFGEVQVSLQRFRRLPMLIKVSNGQEEKRFAIPPRFQEAVTHAAKASKSMLMERRWEVIGIRYGTLDQVGEASVEEIDAAYDDRRLQALSEAAFHYDEEGQEAPRWSDRELEKLLLSDDWRERFAALSQIGADPQRADLLVEMAGDPKMNIRRLCVVYLGLIQGERVLEPLCAALKDDTVAVRRTAGDALTDLGDRRAIGPMVQTLKDTNKLVRWRAARFLFEHGDRPALSALAEVADDPEFEVRMQVRQAIERIESGGEAQGTVWQQLTRPSES